MSSVSSGQGGGGPLCHSQVPPSAPQVCLICDSEHSDVHRRAKQEKRQQRRQVPQEKKLEAGVRVRSRAAAHSSAPKAAEEPEYKKVYKPRVCLPSKPVGCNKISVAGAIATITFTLMLPNAQCTAFSLSFLKGLQG